MFAFIQKGPNALRGGPKAGRTSTRFSARLVVAVVAASGLVVGTATAAGAWNTKNEQAGSVCTPTGTVDVTGSIKNNEPSNSPQNNDMRIRMVRILPNGTDGEATAYQLVPRQQTGNFVIHTTLAQIAAGKVRFDLKWKDGSGYDKRFANFPAAGPCKQEVPVPPQPPTNDPCNPPGVTDNVTWVPEGGPADDTNYNWTLNNDGSLSVEPQPSKEFPGQQQKYTFYLPEDSGEVCTEEVTPVAPVVVQSTCVPGSTTPTVPTLTLGTTGGITYTASAAAPYAPGQTVTVTATWDAYSVQPETLPSGWVKTGEKTATYTVTFDNPTCTVPPPPNPTKVTGMIKVIDKCGTANDKVKALKRYGVSYQRNGHFMKAGVWRKAHNGDVITAKATKPGTVYAGQAKWVVHTTNAPCQPPGTGERNKGQDRTAAPFRVLLAKLR